MKFVVDSVTKCAPRLGILKEIQKHPDKVLETPMAMLYTRGGSIPHITNEVYKLVCKDLQIIQIPLVSTYNFEEAMVEFDGNITDFVGMKDCLSCVTVQDPGDYTQPGHHFQDSVSLWTRKGKVLINAESYMNLIESFKPDMYYLLSDGDTNIASSTKRTSKAVTNTINYFNQCLKRHSECEGLKDSFVMGAIAGGYSLKARKHCMDSFCNNVILGGFLIDGLHNNGPEAELQNSKELTPVVQFVIENLQEEKLRAVQGCWNPVTVLELVQMGVDMFDTSYCYILTERFCALTFSLDLETDQNGEYELNLRQPQLAYDFQSILPGCKCLACTKYSRGYIHHLVTVQELLGPLLLNIHNVHHYLKFFEKIRECIKEGTLNQLQENITKQFYFHQEIVTKKQQTENITKLKKSTTSITAIDDNLSSTSDSTENPEVIEAKEEENIIVTQNQSIKSNS